MFIGPFAIYQIHPSVGLSQHASAIYKHFNRGRFPVTLQYTKFKTFFLPSPLKFQ